MFKVRSVQRDADEEELGEGRQMPGRCVVVPVAEMVLVNSPAVKSQLWFAWTPAKLNGWLNCNSLCWCGTIPFMEEKENSQ